MTSLRTRVAAAALCALCATFVHAQPSGPTEAQKRANCRQAVDQAVEQLKRIPPADERDRKRKDALQARIEGLIGENRRKGVDECTTWTQVMGLAFNS